jgi:hypothetical protein
MVSSHKVNKDVAEEHTFQYDFCDIYLSVRYAKGHAVGDDNCRVQEYQSQ